MRQCVCVGVWCGLFGFFCISSSIIVGRYLSKAAGLVCSRKTKVKLKGRNKESVKELVKEYTKTRKKVAHFNFLGFLLRNSY